MFFVILTENVNLTNKQVVAAIRRNLHSLYGEVIVADSRFFLHTFNEETGAGIIQVCERVLTKVVAAAALIHEVDSIRVSFVPIKTSGTIHALLKKLNSYHRDLIN